MQHHFICLLRESRISDLMEVTCPAEIHNKYLAVRSDYNVIGTQIPMDIRLVCSKEIEYDPAAGRYSLWPPFLEENPFGYTEKVTALVSWS